VTPENSRQSTSPGPRCCCGTVLAVPKATPGHAQVGAEHVDAGLPVCLPVIGQARHGVDSGQPHGRLAVSELGGDRGEPFVEHASAVMNRISLSDLLPPVGHDQRHQGTRASDRREHQLQHAHGVVQRDRAVLREPGMVQQGPRQPGQARQPERRGRETGGQSGTCAGSSRTCGARSTPITGKQQSAGS